MKVLMFGWEFPPNISGGLGTACYGLTKGLSEIGGADVTFVIPASTGDENAQHVKVIAAWQPEQIAECALTLPGLPPKLRPYISAADYAPDDDHAVMGQGNSSLFDDVRAYAQTVSSLLQRHGRFDIIHAHDWLTFPAAIEAKRLLNVPLVAHVHSTEFDRAGACIDKQIFDMEKMGMDAADAVIAVSELTRKTIIARYGQPSEKVFVVHNAVVEELQDNNIPPRASMPFTVSFIGRVTFQKGPEYFIEAAARVLESKQDVRFVLAGDGDMLLHIKALVASLRLGEFFEFPGFISQQEVRNLHARSHVYVMPSVSEPFGIAALEAIACGVPVIVSRCSGVAEVFNSVIKVDHWDVDTIASEVLRLISDNDHANALSAGAKKELGKLSWQSSAEKTRTLYRKAIDAGGQVSRPRLAFPV